MRHFSPFRANSPLNESDEELRMKQWCLCFYSSFPFLFKIMQSKQTDLELLQFIFEEQKNA